MNPSRRLDVETRILRRVTPFRRHGQKYSRNRSRPDSGAAHLPLLSDDEGQHYHMLGGFALGRVPRTRDVFERRGDRFEVVDMDGNRVDRVLVSRAAPSSESA